MNYRTDYPENLAAGQVWTVPADVNDDSSLMLVVIDHGILSSFPEVMAVTRLSDLNDPRLIAVDNTPLGEPVGLLDMARTHMGPQVFGELLGDLFDPQDAFKFRTSGNKEAAAALGLRHADGPEDIEGVRRLMRSFNAVMMHDPNPTRVDVPLSEALDGDHGLPLRVVTDCCPGKSCGTTTLRLAAFRVIATGEVQLRYARESNDNDYIVGTQAELAEFVTTRARQ